MNRKPSKNIASQKLQQRLRGKNSLNSMLKKAYTPGATPSHGVGGVTPGMTPGMKKVSFISTPSSHKTDQAVHFSSVTDNLL